MKRRIPMKTLFLVPALVVLSAAAPAQAAAEVLATDPAHLIIPGQNIGMVMLGMSEADLIQVLGPADSMTTDPTGMQTYHWYHEVKPSRTWGHTTALSVWLKDSIVRAVLVADPTYFLETGLHCSSTAQEVENVYGRPLTERKTVLRYDAPPKTIPVRVLDYRGVSIWVDTTDPEGRVIGIFVLPIS
jgi:hypothetical protein